VVGWETGVEARELCDARLRRSSLNMDPMSQQEDDEE